MYIITIFWTRNQRKLLWIYKKRTTFFEWNHRPGSSVGHVRLEQQSSENIVKIQLWPAVLVVSCCYFMGLIPVLHLQLRPFLSLGDNMYIGLINIYFYTFLFISMVVFQLSLEFQRTFNMCNIKSTICSQSVMWCLQYSRAAIFIRTPRGIWAFKRLLTEICLAGLVEAPCQFTAQPSSLVAPNANLTSIHREPQR